MSTELTIEAVTAKVAEVAAKLPPTGKIIRMEIGLERPVVYNGQTSPASVDNVDREPSATISMDFPTFVALSEGKTTGPAALMAGKLKITGDMAAALAFQSVMDRVQKEWRGS